MKQDQQKIITERASRRGNTCLGAGVIGSVFAAICCATPILSIALALAGLAIIVPYLDYVVVPALLVFLIVALYGYVRCRDEGAQPK